MTIKTMSKLFFVRRSKVRFPIAKSKFSNAIVQFLINFSNNRNRTTNSIRHVNLLLWCISELTVVFIKDVKPLASFCLKSFSWSSDVF